MVKSWKVERNYESTRTYNNRVVKVVYYSLNRTADITISVKGDNKAFVSPVIVTMQFVVSCDNKIMRYMKYKGKHISPSICSVKEYTNSNYFEGMKTDSVANDRLVLHEIDSSLENIAIYSGFEKLYNNCKNGTIQYFDNNGRFC